MDGREDYAKVMLAGCGRDRSLKALQSIARGRIGQNGARHLRARSATVLINHQLAEA